MISLDQVLLLQKKVETAVEKIGTLTNTVSQLKGDNDALRSKCAELTKALSNKTEQVSTLEDEQGKIEEGIMNALNRLSTVENSVLNTAGSTLENQDVKKEEHVNVEGQKSTEAAIQEHKDEAEPNAVKNSEQHNNQTAPNTNLSSSSQPEIF